MSPDRCWCQFSFSLYQRWFSVYNQQKPNVRISYQSIGSGAGVEQFIQGTVDFAASDVAITDEQAAKVERGAITLPMTAGSIVLLQPAQCANWLEATTESIHRYLPGENQELERPQNLQANPGVPSLPIRVHRSDGSGTIHATPECHQSRVEKQSGAAKTVDWPRASVPKAMKASPPRFNRPRERLAMCEYGYATQ